MIEEDMVMAIPRKELYGINGLIKDMSIDVLDSIQNESWFAIPSKINDDFSAKELRIGIIIKQNKGTKEESSLVSEDGEFLHLISAPHTISVFGKGLKSLKEYTKSTIEKLIKSKINSIFLTSYINIDKKSELSGYFFMIYEIVVSNEIETPENMAWVNAKNIPSLNLSELETIVLGEK